jgi:hypothetical protein
MTKISVVGSRERREDWRFVLLSAEEIRGQYRYIVDGDGDILMFEGAEAAERWAEDAVPAGKYDDVGVMAVQVPQREVIDKKLIKERLSAKIVLDDGTVLRQGIDMEEDEGER